MKHISALLDFQIQEFFYLLDVLIKPPAQIGKAPSIVRQESHTQGIGCHAGKMVPRNGSPDEYIKLFVSLSCYSLLRLEAPKQGVCQRVSNCDGGKLAN